MEYFACAPIAREEAGMMGLGGGGRMRQTIERDPFRLSDWNVAASRRVLVSLVHAKDWKTVTGEAAPNQPPTAQDYARSGLPWFEWYGRDQTPLPGGYGLRKLESVGQVFNKKTGATLPNSEDVLTGAPKPLGPGAPRPIRSSGAW